MKDHSDKCNIICYRLPPRNCPECESRIMGFFLVTCQLCGRNKIINLNEIAGSWHWSQLSDLFKDMGDWDIWICPDCLPLDHTDDVDMDELRERLIVRQKLRARIGDT